MTGRRLLCRKQACGHSLPPVIGAMLSRAGEAPNGGFAVAR